MLPLVRSIMSKQPPAILLRNQSQTRIKTSGSMGGKALAYGGIGTLLAALENRVVGEYLPESLQKVNLGIGAGTGIAAALGGRSGMSHALLSVPIKQMGLFGIGSLEQSRKQQRGLMDLQLDRAGVELDTAKVHANSAKNQRLRNFIYGMAALTSAGALASIARKYRPNTVVSNPPPSQKKEEKPKANKDNPEGNKNPAMVRLRMDMPKGTDSDSLITDIKRIGGDVQEYREKSAKIPNMVKRASIQNLPGVVDQNSPTPSRFTPEHFRTQNFQTLDRQRHRSGAVPMDTFQRVRNPFGVQNDLWSGRGPVSKRLGNEFNSWFTPWGLGSHAAENAVHGWNTMRRAPRATFDSLADGRYGDAAVNALSGVGNTARYGLAAAGIGAAAYSTRNVPGMLLRHGVNTASGAWSAGRNLLGYGTPNQGIGKAFSRGYGASNARMMGAAAQGGALTRTALGVTPQRISNWADSTRGQARMRNMGTNALSDIRGVQQRVAANPTPASLKFRDIGNTWRNSVSRAGGAGQKLRGMGNIARRMPWYIKAPAMVAPFLMSGSFGRDEKTRQQAFQRWDMEDAMRNQSGLPGMLARLPMQAAGAFGLTNTPAQGNVQNWYRY